MYENGQLLVLNMQDILPNRFQPRIRFDEQKLNELAESIRKYGVIQPIVVRQIGNKYEIIAGERRYKASQIANREVIPAIVINLSDKDSEEIALLENVQRQELTPIEEAVSYKRILDMGYITQEGLAQKLGKTQSTIANKVRLLNLDDHVQDALLHGKISERHARSLLRLTSKSIQVQMLNRIISERLTVKKTDEEINKLLESRPEGGEQHTIPSAPRTEPVMTAENLFKETPKPRRAIPVASHEIIRVNPPKELQEQNKPKEIFNNKKERGQGFMDIDKIMKEAQDINQITQPNDISDLMKQGVSAPNPAPAAPTPVPEPEANKFVNFNGMMIENEKTPTPAAPINNAVSFDSIFNQQPAPVPAPAPTPAVPVPDQVLQQQRVEPVPTLTPVAPVPSPTSPPIPELVPAVPTPVEPEPIYGAPLQQYAQPPLTNIPTDEIIEQPAPQYTQAAPAQMESMPQKAVPDQNARNFRQIINLIRNCADKIEELGYYIDLDEIDLGNSYQVTFKIDKE